MGVVVGGGVVGGEVVKKCKLQLQSKTSDPEEFGGENPGYCALGKSLKSVCTSLAGICWRV